MNVGSIDWLGKGLINVALLMNEALLLWNWKFRKLMKIDSNQNMMLCHHAIHLFYNNLRICISNMHLSVGELTYVMCVHLYFTIYFIHIICLTFYYNTFDNLMSNSKSIEYGKLQKLMNLLWFSYLILFEIIF